VRKVRKFHWGGKKDVLVIRQDVKEKEAHGRPKRKKEQIRRFWNETGIEVAIKTTARRNKEKQNV